MALSETYVDPRLRPIIDQVARTVGPLGVSDARDGKPAVLRVVPEFSVRRVIQAYWTPFEVNVPGSCLGLYLEVGEPIVRWGECYLSPEYRNWVLFFAQREDGEVQLAYYADYETPQAAIDGFIEHAAWYVLTASDITWDDVAFDVDQRLGWTDHLTALTTTMSAATAEALKKSTIMWLRWNLNGTERSMPVWYVYDNKTEKIYVLSGERQQTIPGAERLREATVVLRWKGKNSQVAEIPADVRVLEHGEQWDEIAEKIAEKRLNIPGLPEETAKRWRDECVILELSLRA